MITKEVERSQSSGDLLPEAKAAFEHTCQYYLRISGTEFLRRLDRGEIHRDESNTALCRVLAMLPFIR